MEFLDECLEAHNDNILQENLWTVLTSSEMIALSRVMSIVHYKIALPMRWLADNTHLMAANGFNWSARSMGKAIDALHDALVKIAKNGNLFLNEEFMNKIFLKLTRTTMVIRGRSGHLSRRCNTIWVSH